MPKKTTSPTKNRTRTSQKKSKSTTRSQAQRRSVPTVRAASSTQSRKKPISRQSSTAPAKTTRSTKSAAVSTWRPFIIFVVALIGLFALIVASNSLRDRQSAPEPVEETVSATPVEIYSLGEAYLTTQAKVDNRGVINILAQSSGVVQRVNVKEGAHVYRGQQLASLSSNYQGANASALQLELAEKNWLMTHANYWDQEKVDDINLELNRNTAWVTQWETNPSRTMMGNGDAYTSFTGQQNQELLALQDAMTQRGQQLSLDQAENNYFAAQIAASLMYPATPVAGTIEKVNIKVGDVVAAGQVVAVVKADKGDTRLEVAVSETLLRNLSLTASAYFEYAGQRYEVNIDYLPTTPNSGNSYDLRLTLDPEVAELLPHGTYVDLHLPLDAAQSGRILLPLNAVYQTQMAAYVYVVDHDARGQAVARQTPVVLGAVIGDLVTVEQGVSVTDQIILNNNLLDGELISYTPVDNTDYTSSYQTLLENALTASEAARLILE